jgi:hypothetical protein
VQQVVVRFDTAGTARQHETVNRGAGFCAVDRVTEQPRGSARASCPFILPISGRKLRSIIVGIRCMDVVSRLEMLSCAAEAG